MGTSFLNDQEFEHYRELIYNESGIHFSAANRSILESRLRERLRLTKIETPALYLKRIRANGDEMKVLLDSVTTNLTRFFRNTAHFQTLEYSVLPDLIRYKQDSGNKILRIWSAGCSTGEEPYSLAMVCRDLLPADLTVEITASDLSLKSLMTAKEGLYSEQRLSGIPDKYVKRFFKPEGDSFRVTDEIKKLIKFDYHNLKFDSGLRNLDLVFCRNVIIYFDEAAQEAVIQKFWQAMNGHSYLFIGHSESLFGMKTSFEFLKTDWACIYRKFT